MHHIDQKTIVVGAGFGGLAAALRARALGHDVTLLERLPTLGGRGRVIEEGQFRFDGGPTVITAPFLLEELFALFDENLADHVELIPVTPFYRIVFADGRHFDYTGDRDAMCREIERFAPGDIPGYLRLLARSERLYTIGYERYGATPFHKPVTMLRALPALLAQGGYRSVYNMVRRDIRDDRLRRVFSLQPLLVGGHPFHTSGIYALIQHLERAHGVFFPRGGTGALVSALVSLARRHGVEIRTGADVAEITHADGRATGVRLAGGERLPATAVIANADAPALYASLLPGRRRRRWTDRRLRGLHFSMGLFVLYFGTEGRYEDVAHHTIILGQRYRALLDEVFGRTPRIPDDPSLYLHRPTATDPGMAPPGRDAFYVLAPVPNLRAPIDWDRAGPLLRDRIVALLEAGVLPGLSSRIVAERFITPKTFETDFRSLHGAGFSVAPRLTQSAWFRFHNRSEELSGLYLVGAGTHPGAGLPGVLTSAKVVETLLAGRPGAPPLHPAGLPAPRPHEFELSEAGLGPLAPAGPGAEPQPVL